MEHSKTFPFSSGDRWANCSGSVKMVADEPDRETAESMEGSAAHWVGSTMLEVWLRDGNPVKVGREMVGMPAPNGVIITEDMFDAALTYYQIVTPNLNRWDDTIRIEHKTGAYQTLDPEAYGTTDLFAHRIETNTLRVWDFKYGHGRVKAYDNFQLAGYAIALIEEMNLHKLNPRIVMSIIQPRCYDGQGPLLEWVTNWEDLRAHINVMKSAITDHRMNQGRLKTGRWCRECPARYKCPAILEAAAQAVDFSVEPIPVNMTNDALGYELEVIDRAQARLKERAAAIGAEAEARIRKGELIPGRIMVDTVGKRVWKDAATARMLGETLGVNFMKDPEPISPFQAEKELKSAGMDDAVAMISPYIIKPITGAKLVADDGSRAAQIFSQEKLKHE